MRIGFPPKPLPSTTASTTSLESLGLRSGDQIAVSRVEGLPAPINSSSVTSLSTPKSHSTKPESPAGLSVEVNGGYLVLRVVPDDNSCLFTSIGLVLDQNLPAMKLRQIIAKAIESDPSMWSESMLGLASSTYISNITKSSSWGGAIELAIFASYYKTEIISIDVATGRQDQFGQGAGYDRTVFLVYSGIHYDALTFSYLEPSRSAVFPPEHIEFDATSFESDQVEIMSIAAAELVNKLKSMHYYTSTATFTCVLRYCRSGNRPDLQKLDCDAKSVEREL